MGGFNLYPGVRLIDSGTVRLKKIFTKKVSSNTVLIKYFQGDYSSKTFYRELTEALQQEIQARKESVAAHAEEIAAFDMKINYLRVRTEDLRQKNGVEADLERYSSFVATHQIYNS